MEQDPIHPKIINLKEQQTLTGTTRNLNDAFCLANKRDTLVKAYWIKLEDNVWTEHCGQFGELDDQDDDARNPQRLARQDTLM